jgi:hypothetical protein
MSGELEIRPCPFCGGYPETHQFKTTLEWNITCYDCGGGIEPQQTLGQAVSLWNGENIK